jgi:hypothetical protein
MKRVIDGVMSDVLKRIPLTPPSPLWGEDKGEGA